LNAQPHERAMHADHVPVLDDPRALPSREPRLSFLLIRQHRSSVRDAWRALDQLKRGSSPMLPTPCTDTTTPAARLAPRNAKRFPVRYLGHGAVLLLVLSVVLSGGLPALALEMDWHQGATVATDHVNESQSTEAGMSVPLVLSELGSALSAGDAAKQLQDSRVPSLLPRQSNISSAFATTHTVAAGEKLGLIAARYNVSPLAIVAANNLDPKLLAIGQELRIPKVSGVPHVVAEGETIESIAALYHVDTSAIRFFPSNNLGNGRTLNLGEELFIPGAQPSSEITGDIAEATAIPMGVVLDDETRIRGGPSTEYEKIAKLSANTRVVLVGRHESWLKIQTVNGTDGWIAAELLNVVDGVLDQVPTITDIPPLPTPEPTPAPAVEKPAAPANRWVWPASGDLTSGFGYRNMRVGRFHNGIDIANRKGTPIRAARGGKVIQAGWCSGYGYCVKINHGDGFVTEYGHLASQPVVRAGQYVEAGQRIGSMGNTFDRRGGGYSTGVHLHFTVKRNGQAVNPMRYLP